MHETMNANKTKKQEKNVVKKAFIKELKQEAKYKNGTKKKRR